MMMYTEDKMNNFFKIVAGLHICNNAEFEKNEPKMTEIEQQFESLVGEKKGRELSEEVFAYGMELKRYSMVEGMKMAIEIMDGRYIPTIN